MPLQPLLSFPGSFYSSLYPYKGSLYLPAGQKTPAGVLPYSLATHSPCWPASGRDENVLFSTPAWLPLGLPRCPRALFCPADVDRRAAHSSTGSGLAGQPDCSPASRGSARRSTAQENEQPSPREECGSAGRQSGLSWEERAVGGGDHVALRAGLGLNVRRTCGFTG